MWNINEVLLAVAVAMEKKRSDEALTTIPRYNQHTFAHYIFFDGNFPKSSTELKLSDKATMWRNHAPSIQNTLYGFFI